MRAALDDTAAQRLEVTRCKEMLQEAGRKLTELSEQLEQQQEQLGAKEDEVAACRWGGRGGCITVYTNAMIGPTNPTATPPPQQLPRATTFPVAPNTTSSLTIPAHCETKTLNRCEAVKLRASLTSSDSALMEAREAVQAAQAEGGRLAERERERAAQAAVVSERERERERERAVQAGAAAAAREGELEGQLAAAARLQVFTPAPPLFVSLSPPPSWPHVPLPLPVPIPVPAPALPIIGDGVCIALCPSARYLHRVFP